MGFGTLNKVEVNLHPNLKAFISSILKHSKISFFLMWLKICKEQEFKYFFYETINCPFQLLATFKNICDAVNLALGNIRVQCRNDNNH